MAPKTIFITATLASVCAAAYADELLNNGTLGPNGGRAISAQWTVFQPFTVTDPAWFIQTIGTDGFEQDSPAGTGMLGTLLPDDGAGNPDEAHPIASAVFFMPEPLVPPVPRWVDMPFNIVLPAGNYWMRWDANGDIGYFGAVWTGTSGPQSFSRNNFTGAIFHRDPTALRIFGNAVAGCPDFDGSGAVDLADLAVLLSNFGMAGATFSDGDIDGDGNVNLSDLALILSMFDSSCG